jgi:hypothetical protein
MMKGAMHVHSTYSDGEFTLAELREVYLAEGCGFVCMTDHAEYFDADSIGRYQRECDALSDDKLCMIAGLEYRCEREMHILGYGATALSSVTEPQAIIQHIQSQGAISVIAHPKNEFFPWIESFKTLPQGIETWNSKYDGRYAPRPGTFALLQKLQQREARMLAFYGQDLHWKKQFRGLFVEMDNPAAESKAILAAIREGKYEGRKDLWQLPSSGIVPEELLAKFGRMQSTSSSMWRFFKNSKGMLDRLGIPVPESLKARLRKIF